MALSYNKLWKLLIDKGMTKTEMRLKADISTTTLAKMGKNETVSMEVLLRICKVLKCDISDIMELTKEESEEDGKLNSMMCRAISMEILAQAFRAYQRGQGGTDELIRAVSTYVRENIRSSLSLDDIAKHIGLSAPYLSSLFHQKSGMRLSDFIRSTRISVAAGRAGFA